MPIIEKDVDGANSLPLRIDGEVPNLGKFAACRRVARTIYLGSAPITAAANRGLEDRRIKGVQLKAGYEVLGGDNGLRGYPLRYQAGTSMALLTLEERYYTDWYPFRLFHVAGAVFYDMGRTWGMDVTGATSAGLLKDVGIGLRLGSSRSAFGNVLHVDLAFPLDGDPSISNVQFVVETKGQF